MQTRPTLLPAHDTSGAPPTPEVLLMPDVFGALLDETVRYGAEGQETGGILIGKWLSPSKVLVIAVTGPGPRADHQQFTFAIDVDYANAELERVSRIYPGSDYVGEWHKHPPTLDRPSRGDLQTVRRQLADPAYPDRLISPITVIRNGPQVFFYTIDRVSNIFAAVQPRVLTGNEAAQALTTPAVTLPRLGPAGASATSAMPAVMGPPWWTRPGGAERLVEERTALAAAHFGIARDEIVEGSRIITVTDRGWLMGLECHSNYPRNAPLPVRVARNGKDLPLDKLALVTLTNWNERTLLVGVCREIEQVMGGSRRRAPFVLLGALGIAAILLLAVVLLLAQNNSAAATPLADSAAATSTANSFDAVAKGAGGTLTAGSIATANGIGTASSRDSSATALASQAAAAATNALNTDLTISALAAPTATATPTVPATTAPATKPAAPTAPPKPVVVAPTTPKTGYQLSGFAPKSGKEFADSILGENPVARDGLQSNIMVSLNDSAWAKQGWVLTIGGANATIYTTPLDHKYVRFAQSHLTVCYTAPCTTSIRDAQGNIIAQQQYDPLPFNQQTNYILSVTKS